MDRIAGITRTLGVSEDAAKTLLSLAAEQQDVPDERLAEVLTKIAEDYKRLQAKVVALDPDDPAARQLVAQAQTEINAGHFNHAHDLLRQATQSQLAAAQEANKLMTRAQAAVDARMLGATRSTATEGDLALTERNYVHAADPFAVAAEYVAGGNPEAHAEFLTSRANALLRQGDERGDNAALHQAINNYQAVGLGERESSEARLEEAVAAYRAALQEYTRDRVPLEWAATQTNLGVALYALGARESGTAQLEEAIAAYRAALQEYRRDQVPLDWATTQNNLGIALLTLGARETGTARAKAAFGEALKILSTAGANPCTRDIQASQNQAMALLRLRQGVKGLVMRRPLIPTVLKTEVGSTTTVTSTGRRYTSRSPLPSPLRWAARLPIPAPIEEQVDTIVSPAIEFSSSHRRPEAEGTALWHGNQEGKELLGGEFRPVDRKATGACLALQHCRDLLDRVDAAAFACGDRGKLGEALRLDQHQSGERERHRGNGCVHGKPRETV
jgi:tetratricopeptide (TPR) repeat protein